MSAEARGETAGAAGTKATGKNAADKYTFTRVLDELGRAIVAGELTAGPAGTIDDLVVRVGASRSVVREVTRVLGTLGMMSAGRRVGLTILDAEHWDVLDPLVIRWRLDSKDRQAQIAEIRALRAAIEPAAAAAAARAVSSGVVAPTGVAGEASAVRAEGLPEVTPTSIANAAERLRTAADAGDTQGFLDADRDFHAAILAASGNMMFARLQAVIDENLRDRALRERADQDPDDRDVELHGLVADAVRRGNADAARALMAEIVERTGGPGR